MKKEKRTYTIKDLKEFAESKGGRCLSDVYINSNTKYLWEDENGQTWTACWNVLVTKGQWSPHTAQQRKSQTLTQFTIEDLKAYAITKGGKCLSEVYTKDKDKYQWEDSKGRAFTMPWSRIRSQGSWSPHEKREKLAEMHKKYNIDTTRSFGAKNGWLLLNETYQGYCNLHEWVHLESGRKLSRSLHNLICRGFPSKDHSSKEENKVANFLTEDLGVTNIVRNDRKLIKPLELDIYSPEHKIAIEYNGCRWHTDDRIAKNYHLTKHKECKNVGIELLQFFDTEWKERSEQIKSFIRSKFNKNSLRIGARKTELKTVSYKDANEFLEKYHILGSTNIKYAYGLYFNNELVQLTTFNFHHRSGIELVLNRFVGKTDVSVSGGLSKLCKHALSQHGEFTTWIDLRMSSGDSWINSGWMLIHQLRPDYFYFNPDTKKAVSKQSRRKSAVNTPEGMTEFEHATKDGLLRIYDAGKLKLRYS